MNQDCKNLEKSKDFSCRIYHGACGCEDDCPNYCKSEVKVNIKKLAARKVENKPNYNFEHQIKEELFELAIAFKNYQRNPNPENAEDIKEELSDVFFNLTAYCIQKGIDFDDLDIIAHRKTIHRFPEEL